ncbi:MAG: type II toxin-antitoxin system Phd/YefM family antitoxin [Faecousia sp.]
MTNTNITNFRKNIFTMLEQTIRYNEPLHISTKEGNVVVLSEEDYRGVMETLQLLSSPQMKQKLLDGKETPLDDCVPESEVGW